MEKEKPGQADHEAAALADRCARVAVAPLEGESLPFRTAVEMAAVNVAAKITPLIAAALSEAVRVAVAEITNHRDALEANLEASLLDAAELREALRVAVEKEREATRALADPALKLAIAVRHAFEASDRAAMALFGTNAPAFFARDVERTVYLRSDAQATPALEKRRYENDRFLPGVKIRDLRGGPKSPAWRIVRHYDNGSTEMIRLRRVGDDMDEREIQCPDFFGEAQHFEILGTPPETGEKEPSR